MALLFVPAILMTSILVWGTLRDEEPVGVFFTSLGLMMFLVMGLGFGFCAAKSAFPRRVTFDVSARSISGRQLPGFDLQRSFDQIEAVEFGIIADCIWIRLVYRSKRWPLILLATHRVDESSIDELAAVAEQIARVIASLLACPLNTRVARWALVDPLIRSSWW